MPITADRADLATTDRWTADYAEDELRRTGIVWSLGQLSPAAKRRLDRIAVRERECWPWYHYGTCRKVCWRAEEASS